jgi:uncharacterized paraquat-inducible protein A
MNYEPSHVRAHKHTCDNADELRVSARCGCCYCRAVYDARTITDWIDNGRTARCPRCGLDAVIGDASGFAIDDTLLRAMSEHWFATH